MKPTIIHFIYSLGRGGAETMIVRVIRELSEYRHVIVTLEPENHFGDELVCDRLVCLRMGSLARLPLMISAFKKIVKEESPALVHTHLFWPTLLARIGLHKSIPLVTTIHAFIASSVEYKHWYIRFLDRITFRIRKSIIVVVAKGALEEYLSFLKCTPYKAVVLYTFVDINRFTRFKEIERKDPLFKIIAVGALRIQKNYPLLIEAMSRIKQQNIVLDIYGTGSLKQELERQIEKTGARVTLKGEVRDIEKILPRYDLYLMGSTFEGFSLSVLEAMAVEMPLLLSDITSFREQCGEIAWYFKLDDPDGLAAKIEELSRWGKEELEIRGKQGRFLVEKYFTLDKHIKGIRNIYQSAIDENSATV